TRGARTPDRRRTERPHGRVHAVAAALVQTSAGAAERRTCNAGRAWPRPRIRPADDRSLPRLKRGKPMRTFTWLILLAVTMLAGCHGSTTDAIYPGSLGHEPPPAIGLPAQDAGMDYR